MISSLRMYEFPELQNSLDNYWNLIHNELLSNDINSPLSLDTSSNEQQVWLDPNLVLAQTCGCLLYTSPSPRDKRQPRMPSSA